MLGGGAGIAALPACASGTATDLNPDDPEAGDGKRDGVFSFGHSERTVERLINVFLPSDGPSSPGAIETGAAQLIGASTLLTVAINLGFLPPLPDFIMADLDALSRVVTRTVVADLDVAAKRRGGLFATFNDLSFDDQAAIVEERWADSLLNPVYQFVRATAMVSFLAAPLSDAGLPVLGLPRYVDFADHLHNTGYADYSYNRLPSVDGRAVYDLTVDGDLP